MLRAAEGTRNPIEPGPDAQPPWGGQRHAGEPKARPRRKGGNKPGRGRAGQDFREQRTEKRVFNIHKDKKCPLSTEEPLPEAATWRDGE